MAELDRVLTVMMCSGPSYRRRHSGRRTGDRRRRPGDRVSGPTDLCRVSPGHGHVARNQLLAEVLLEGRPSGEAERATFHLERTNGPPLLDRAATLT